MGDQTSGFVTVIRSSGERTFDACHEIVRLQADGNPVHVVREHPFKKALEACYSVAIDAGTKWLVTVDADMLLLPDAIETLIDFAEDMPENYLQLQARIFDNITGTVRKAGPRIYRTACLGRALSLSIESGDRIRPENFVITRLGEKGFPSRYLSKVVALHDFEQYYRDLYRKARVHAEKHREMLPEIILRAADNTTKINSEGRVIMKAVWHGLTESKPISIDSRIFEEESARTLRELGLTEKPVFPFSNDLPERLTGILPEDYRLTSDESAGRPVEIQDQPKPERSMVEKAEEVLRREGRLGGAAHGLGALMRRIADKLQNL